VLYRLVGYLYMTVVATLLCMYEKQIDDELFDQNVSFSLCNICVNEFTGNWCLAVTNL